MTPILWENDMELWTDEEIRDICAKGRERVMLQDLFAAICLIIMIVLLATTGYVISTEHESQHTEQRP